MTLDLVEGFVGPGIGQIEVEEQRIEAAAADLLHGVAQLGDVTEAEPAALEKTMDQTRVRRIVLDEQEIEHWFLQDRVAPAKSGEIGERDRARAAR